MISKKNTGKQLFWIARDKYNGQKCKISTDDIKQLKRGVPVDYIIGWKVFLGCKIGLSSKPLIPREETEFWVEKSLSEMAISTKKQIKVLDMFSGSGCIGISALKNDKRTHVTFAEIDKKLIKQIKDNLKINGLEKKRSKVIQSNLFKSLKGKYDFIFANPPYIPTKHTAKIQKSVLLNEPNLALFGGEDGLSLIKPFLRLSKKYLNNDGQIWVEFDPSQKKNIEKIAREAGYSSCIINKDQYGRWRFATISSGR